jgi:hypothetical protein
MAAKSLGTYVCTDPAYIGVGDPTVVDTTQAYPLGTIVKARDVGSTAYGEVELIYLKGGTNVAARSVVTIGSDFSTTLIAARAKGAVAVSLAAVDETTKYGWFVCRGKAAAASDGVSDASACYIDGTAGRVDDAAVAGDQIIGMQTASADDTNTCVVNMLSRPAVADFDNA